jgi:hypothetical protein
MFRFLTTGVIECDTGAEAHQLMEARQAVLIQRLSRLGRGLKATAKRKQLTRGGHESNGKAGEVPLVNQPIDWKVTARVGRQLGRTDLRTLRSELAAKRREAGEAAN